MFCMVICPMSNAVVLNGISSCARHVCWYAQSKSIAVGISLIAASTAIILEPSWSAAEEDQAIDRIHRIDQTRDVSVLWLVAKGSIEEKLRMLQPGKQ